MSTTQLSGNFDGTVTLKPGLDSAPTSQTVDGSCCAGNKGATGIACVSGTGIPYTGLLATFSGSGNVGCATGAPGTQTVSAQVQWFIGDTPSDTSTIDVSASGDGLPLTSVNATVHGGLLDGATVTALFSAVTPIGNCGSAPITSVNYAGTLAFLK